MSHPMPWDPGSKAEMHTSRFATPFKTQAVFQQDSRRLNGWRVSDLTDDAAVAKVGESYSRALTRGIDGTGTAGEPHMWNTPTTSMVLGPSIPVVQETLVRGPNEPVLPFATLNYSQPAAGARCGPRSTYSFM
jgi:hypothetical protein